MILGLLINLLIKSDFTDMFSYRALTRCLLITRLCCISPVLAAKVLPGVDVTVGHEEEEGGKWPYAGTTQAITALGAKHTVKEVTISYLNSLFSSLYFLKSQNYKTINLTSFIVIILM